MVLEKEFKDLLGNCNELSGQVSVLEEAVARQDVTIAALEGELAQREFLVAELKHLLWVRPCNNLSLPSAADVYHEDGCRASSDRLLFC